MKKYNFPLQFNTFLENQKFLHTANSKMLIPKSHYLFLCSLQSALHEPQNINAP